MATGTQEEPITGMMWDIRGTRGNRGQKGKQGGKRGQRRTCRGKIEQWGMTGSNVGPKGQQGGIVMGPTGTKGVIMGVMGSLKCEFVLV